MTTFSAGPQALGYLYQARVALSVLLEAPDEALLRVEALDDIELSGAVSAESLSLMQLKHHTGKVTLTDSSTDLWKSLRVWSEQAKQTKFALEHSKILLFTTATVADGSIASFLGVSERDVDKAEKMLLQVAKVSANKSLIDAFNAFNALTDAQRKSLLNVLVIVGNYPNIEHVKKKIDGQLRLAVRAKHLIPFSERVEGWWTNKIILHLLAKTPQYANGVTAFELHEQVATIASSFHDESLPIDYEDFGFEESDLIASESRQFVAQLRAVDVPARTIRKAILDYHRAYNQRHRWLKDALIFAAEIEKYEDKLRDEWERYFDNYCADFDKNDQLALMQAGKSVLRWAEMECALRIRPRVDADYIRRGSFHILADKTPPDIRWHPSFDELMMQTLTSALPA